MIISLFWRWMMDTNPRINIIPRTLRWVARILSIPCLITILLPFFVEGPIFVTFTSVREWLQMFLFIGIGVGLVLGWRREGIGGCIVVGCTLLFYLVMYLIEGRLPEGPFLLLLAVPGALFLLTWAVEKHARK
jgi:peptidoglycan/LPS O-acetylase OafA/YrhL